MINRFKLIIAILISFSLNAQTEISYSEINSVLDVKDKLIMIEYYTDWCIVCKKMDPIYEQLAEKHKDEMIFYKVDVTNIDEDLINKISAPYAFKGFPAYACYLNDEKENDPISLWYGFKEFEIYDHWISERISAPNAKYSYYEPLFSTEEVKKASVMSVLSWHNREFFTAEHIHDENYDYDDDYFFTRTNSGFEETPYWKENWEKIWSGEIKSNYKYTYISNPEEALTGEDYSQVESGCWYTLNENKGRDLVVVKVEFFDEDDFRAICYVLFDKADNIGGTFVQQVVGTIYPDL